MPSPVIRVEQAVKEYRLGSTLVPALKGVDLTVEAGEFLAIAGPSGSGKTTLLNMIGCIERPTEGRIWINGQDVGGLSPNALADIRAQSIGFIFQQFNLLPVLTALENIDYPLAARRLSGTTRHERALRALADVGLVNFARHKPLELSGGQRQRVAIARAIVTEPLIVLADEPTANLDHATGQDILALMRRINQERQTTFVFSTHDQQVMEMATRVVRLWDGLVAA